MNSEFDGMVQSAKIRNLMSDEDKKVADEAWGKLMQYLLPDEMPSEADTVTETESIRNKLEYFKQANQSGSISFPQYCKDVDALFVSMDERDREIERLKEAAKGSLIVVQIAQQENFLLQQEVEHLKSIGKAAYEAWDNFAWNRTNDSEYAAWRMAELCNATEEEGESG